MDYPEQIRNEPGNQKETLKSEGGRRTSVPELKEHTYMKTEIYPAYNVANIKNCSNRKRKSLPEKHLPKRCSMDQLDEIRIGDRIINADGIKGIVADICINGKKHEKHYYIRLKHGITLLYIV